MRSSNGRALRVRGSSLLLEGFGHSGQAERDQPFMGGCVSIGVSWLWWKQPDRGCCVRGAGAGGRTSSSRGGDQGVLSD